MILLNDMGEKVQCIDPIKCKHIEEYLPILLIDLTRLLPTFHIRISNDEIIKLILTPIFHWYLGLDYLYLIPHSIYATWNGDHSGIREDGNVIRPIVTKYGEKRKPVNDEHGKR